MKVIKFLLMLAAVAGALIAAQVGAASTSTPVSGTYTVTAEGTPTCALVGATQFLIRCQTTGLVSEYSGTMTGVSTADFTTLINCRTSTSQGFGTETFVGSVAGIGSGTLTWGIHFASDFDCGTFSLSAFRGSAAINSGTGALAGQTGYIKFGDTTYTGTLH